LQDVQDGVARYEARWPEPHPLDLTPADPALATYLNYGWGVPSAFENKMALWAVLPDSELMLPGRAHDADLTLTLYVPDAQTLTFILDGKEIARQELPAGVNNISLDIPAATTGFPRHLTIHADRRYPSAGIRVAPRTIGEMGVESPVNIVVRSAGKDVGDFGHIYVDGVDVSPNQRGYNLAAVDPVSGQVLDAASFDTHDPHQAPAASVAMTAWINALPEGVIVAGAVRDAAALSLSDDAVLALHSLGVADDIRGELRRDHAFVGVKGAAPGSAPSATSDLWPATIVIGDGLTTPTPVFALQRLIWTPQ
jgi:hypothetical protein